MGLSRVGGCALTPISEDAREHKHEVLRQHYRQAVAGLGDEEFDQSVLMELPKLGEVTPVYSDVIANVALEFEDDLCVIDTHRGARLILGCVCSPSYWKLTEKVGASLEVVHAPVHGLQEKLGERITHFVQQLPAEVSFCRSNWFLHGSDALYQPIAEARLDIPVVDWVMRCEFQTFYRLNARYVLFSIRVLCEPLKHIREVMGAKDSLLAALGFMDKAEIAHFGGEAKYKKLLDYLTKH